MISVFSLVISVVAVLLSAIAIFITFRKDAYRVKLHLISGNYNDKITIQNDSQAQIQFQSIGVIDWNGEIFWKKGCYDSITNQKEVFPTIVAGRTAFIASIGQPELRMYAYCIQLSCGRTFVVNKSLESKQYFRLVLRSIFSRITAGKYGFPRNYVHLEGMHY